MENKQFQAVAYHEAGRAVEAYLAGRKIEYVENGRVVFDTSWYEQACKSEDVLELEMDTELDICLAGIAAEELYLGENYKPNFEKAKEIAKYLVDDSVDIDLFVEIRYSITKKYLKFSWTPIEEIAEAVAETEDVEEGYGGDIFTYFIEEAVGTMTHDDIMNGTWSAKIIDLLEIEDQSTIEEIKETQSKIQEWYQRMFEESGRIRFDAMLQNSIDTK